MDRDAFSGCADHIINDVVTSVCNRGPQSLLHVDDSNLNADSQVSSSVVIEGQGSEQENGYGSYVFTDQDSNDSPYSYTITGLDTNKNYFVRVSAHTSCDDTCRKGSSDQLGCCGFSYSQVSESMHSPISISHHRLHLLSYSFNTRRHPHV